jgi:two-component system, NarL family, response regulator LiaR
MMHPLSKYSHLILYGCCLSAILFLLKWMQWKFIIVDNAIEIYIGLIACLFTALGIWIALKLTKPKVETRIVEKKIYVHADSAFEIDQQQLEILNLRPREFEVLQLMADGLSNAEIAEKLFISLSTVKTHASGIFEKMDVKRRTQAIEKGKRLHIIR